MRFSSAFLSWQSYKEFIVRASVFISCFSTCGVSEETFLPSKKRVSFYWIWWHIHGQNESEAFSGGKVHYILFCTISYGSREMIEAFKAVTFQSAANCLENKENLPGHYVTLELDAWFSWQLILFSLFLGIASILWIVYRLRTTNSLACWMNEWEL